MTKQQKREQEITNLLESMFMTSKQSDDNVNNMFNVSGGKKEVLYNSTFALIKMIGDLK